MYAKVYQYGYYHRGVYKHEQSYQDDIGNTGSTCPLTLKHQEDASNRLAKILSRSLSDVRQWNLFAELFLQICRTYIYIYMHIHICMYV